MAAAELFSCRFQVYRNGQIFYSFRQLPVPLKHLRLTVDNFSSGHFDVLITIYWLGKAANCCASYNGPTLNLKEFEGLLSLIRKEAEDLESPKRSIRDSGYVDCWDSERSDSLSPPRHGRDDSFDSLDSFGSRSQQTPSPDVVIRGSSDGRGSDSESDVPHRKMPDVRKDDMLTRRTSCSEPRAAMPFNQYLPNKSNQSAYVPAPLRKKKTEREEYRKSWSTATSPIGGERPFSQPETINEEEHEEHLLNGRDDTMQKDCHLTQTISVQSERITGNHYNINKVNERQTLRLEGKDKEEETEEEKKLKRLARAGIKVLPASVRYSSNSKALLIETNEVLMKRDSQIIPSTLNDEENNVEKGSQRVLLNLKKDDLARMRVQSGPVQSAEPRSFVKPSITLSDLQKQQRLMLFPESSEETSNLFCQTLDKDGPAVQAKAAALDDLASQKTNRATKKATGSRQRFVHFGPVTEIDQKSWEKVSIPKTTSEGEATEHVTNIVHVSSSDASSKTRDSDLKHLRQISRYAMTFCYNYLPNQKLAQPNSFEWSEWGCQGHLTIDWFDLSVPQAMTNSVVSTNSTRNSCGSESLESTTSPGNEVQIVSPVNIQSTEFEEDSDEETREGRLPDLEKDDMLARRTGAFQRMPCYTFNQFLPVPGSLQKNQGVDLEKSNRSVSMIDMRYDEEAILQPHSKARHEHLHNLHNLLREEEDKWQDDLARWKNRRRSASQDLIKKEEERKMMERLMSGEQNLSERRRSIKTYKEIVEEKERRERELHEAYRNAKSPEEAEAVLRRYTQRFTISEAVLEKLEIPKILERSLSVDSDTSPKKEPSAMKYLRQQSLPAPKFTATVQATVEGAPLSQTSPQVSPTRIVSSKAVPLLTPKPYSQPRSSQSGLKSLKVDGMMRVNGEAGNVFERAANENESKPLSTSTSTTKKLIIESLARTDPSSNKSLEAPKGCTSYGTEQNSIMSSTSAVKLHTENFQVKSSVRTKTNILQDTAKINASLEKGETSEDESMGKYHEDFVGPKTTELKTLSCSSDSYRDDDVFEDEAIPSSTEEDMQRTPQRDAHSLVCPVADISSTIMRKDCSQLNSFQNNMYCLSMKEKNQDTAVHDNIQKPVKLAACVIREHKPQQLESLASLETQTAEIIGGNILESPINLAKRNEHWSWDPEEERRRQERWQQEQERLLQEKYKKEQEKLKQEWEKAQKEVEEEGRRYHEEERKILEETVTPLTPRSSTLSSPSRSDQPQLPLDPDGTIVRSLADWERKQELLEMQAREKAETCQKNANMQENAHKIFFSSNQETIGKSDAFLKETDSVEEMLLSNQYCGICKGQLGDTTTGTDVRIRNGLLNCQDCYIRSRTLSQAGVVFGRLVIPANTPRPLDGALPAVWRCPKDQQGVTDYVVFIHDPAGYHRGRKRELQGGPKTHLCPITGKYVKGRATCFWGKKKDSYLTRK
ncbi:LIMC1 protein, partial [Polypterus senegalus]